MAKTNQYSTSLKKSTKNPSPADKAKNEKTSTNNEDLKVSPWLEDYLDCFSLKMKPVTKKFIERLSLEINEWSKKDDALVLRDFWDAKDIPEDAFYRWARTHPEFRAAIDIAKGRIGSRREKSALTRKFDPGIVLNSMPMYDPAWREFVQWKASLKQQEESNQKIVIEINDLGRKES